MNTKENLEKAAALFGGSHEPKCVVMTEESKKKIVGGGFVNEKDGAHYAFHGINSEHHEVIGNIYENPELITK